MKIDKFEDIKAWQEARTLVKQIYLLTKQDKFRKDFGLCDQIQRASVSIMANISEGFDAKSKLEFVHFLTFSRRSASEVQSHLYAALDQDYIDSKQFGQTYSKATEIKSLIGGFIRYLNKP